MVDILMGPRSAIHYYHEAFQDSELLLKEECLWQSLCTKNCSHLSIVLPSLKCGLLTLSRKI